MWQCFLVIFPRKFPSQNIFFYCLKMFQAYCLDVFWPLSLEQLHFEHLLHLTQFRSQLMKFPGIFSVQLLQLLMFKGMGFNFLFGFLANWLGFLWINPLLMTALVISVLAVWNFSLLFQIQFIQIILFNTDVLISWPTLYKQKSSLSRLFDILLRKGDILERKPLQLSRR